MNYDKPFKTYEELSELLKSKYSVITDNQAYTLNLLKTVSYYDLKNGYKEYLNQLSSEKDENSIEMLFKFLIYDKNIQIIILKYSFYVENFFKTKFAHFLGKNFGIHQDDYLNRINYDCANNTTKLKKTIREIKKALHVKKAENPTKHYLKNHNHVPPWILFKNAGFYNTVELFKFLSCEHKRKIINDYFDTTLIKQNDGDIILFTTMISNVRSFRNRIAHNHKVITYKSEHKLFLKNYKKIDKYALLTDLDIKYRKGINDLLSTILSISILLNNTTLEIMFFQELYYAMESDLELLKKYENISNLPKNFYKRIDFL